MSRAPLLIFCVLTIRKHLWARPLHLLSQTALPLKSPTGAFIAPLRCANAVQPQNLLRTDEEELCQFDIIPPTTERNRAFPTGNALLYISLSYVDFSGCVLFRGAPCFLFCLISPCFAVLFSLPTDCKRRRSPRTPRTQTTLFRCPWCG